MAPQYGPSPSVVQELFSLASIAMILVVHGNSMRTPSVKTMVVALVGALSAWGLSAGHADLVVGLVVVLACTLFVVLSLGEAEVADTLAMAWVIAAAASAVIGLCQYFDIAQHFPFMSEAAKGEAYGNLRQRNQFATLTSIGLWSALWYLGSHRDRSVRRAIHWGWYATLTLLAAGAAVSSSRTGLLQLVALIGFQLVWKRRDPTSRRLTWLVIGAYWMASVLLPTLNGLDVRSSGILSRIHGAEEMCGSRLTLWSNVLDLIRVHPWAGWGWNELDYAHFITPYEGLRFCEILDNAHNLVLHGAVELGVPFASLMLGVGIWAIARTRPWAENDMRRQLAWGVVGLILLHSMLEYPLWYGPFQMALGLALGVLLRTHKEMSVPSASRKPNEPGLLILRPKFWGYIVLIAATYAGWDYHRVSQIYLAPERRSAAFRTETIDKIRHSWLFRDQALFAEFTTQTPSPANAQWMYQTGERLLHYSPEPAVVERLIDSALLIGRADAAMLYSARYRVAYPKQYARWLTQRTGNQSVE
jgi:O-antigen ligase